VKTGMFVFLYHLCYCSKSVRAHRIGQIRDVHIYRFISKYTVEEALLRKANQKRQLDDLVIQKGEFDWRSLFDNEAALTSALGEVEDKEDAHAAVVAAQEESALYGADEVDFGTGEVEIRDEPGSNQVDGVDGAGVEPSSQQPEDAEEVEEGGTVVDYMLKFIAQDMEFFKDWKV
jgi:helicase SWR1